jgi:hypothetical protein
MNYKLSPSDLTFLYAGCKRCFYNKVVNGIAQPSIPLPAVFSKIAGLLKDHYDGKRTSELHVALPPGFVSHGEQNVKSSIINSTNRNGTCYIAGRFDIVVTFDDGTYGIIDFKTGKPSNESAKLYSHQLQAYAYALQSSAQNALTLTPISKLGLLYFYPSETSQQNIEIINFESEITWIEVENNRQDFLGFVDEVLGILDKPEAPDSDPRCQWCAYLKKLPLDVTLQRKLF